jgi:hypothetical protein
MYVSIARKVLSLCDYISDYLSLYLERVVDCCGAFVGRDGGGCASRGRERNSRGDHPLI